LVAVKSGDGTGCRPGGTDRRPDQHRRPATAASLFIVTKGALRLVRTLADGRRQMVGFVLPGDYVGFSDAPTTATRSKRSPRRWSAGSRCRMKALCDRPALERKLLQRACAGTGLRPGCALALAADEAGGEAGRFRRRCSTEATLGNTTTACCCR
jgi:hypothetical protein